MFLRAVRMRILALSPVAINYRSCTTCGALFHARHGDAGGFPVQPAALPKAKWCTILTFLALQRLHHICFEMPQSVSQVRLHCNFIQSL